MIYKESCLLVTVHRAETCLMGYGRLLRPLGTSHAPYHMSLRHPVWHWVCRGLLARWPSCRMRQSIHYHTGKQQTSACSGTISCYKRGWATVTGILLLLRLDQWKGKFLPGSCVSNLDFGSRFKDLVWFRVCALWLYYLSGNPTLCSFIYEDEGEPTSHPCSSLKWLRATTDRIFWKRRVSRSCLGVFLFFGFVVCLCCFVFLRLLAFLFTYSPTSGNCQSKTNVFMTVWVSSAHGMGRKKPQAKWFRQIILRRKEIN